jgi:hypothetical protein
MSVSALVRSVSKLVTSDAKAVTVLPCEVTEAVKVEIALELALMLPLAVVRLADRLTTS